MEQKFTFLIFNLWNFLIRPLYIRIMSPGVRLDLNVKFCSNCKPGHCILCFIRWSRNALHILCLTMPGRITQRSTKNKLVVVAVECFLSVYFWRMSKVGSKRKKTKNIKYFSKIFYADNYRQRHVKQHLQRWKQHQEARDEEKKTFFEENRPIKETLHHYYGAKQVTQRYLVNASIENVTFGERLWEPENINGSTHTNMKSWLKDYVYESKEVEECRGGDQFCSDINNPV